MSIRNNRIIRKIKQLFSSNRNAYDFNVSNPLGGGGERVDFTYSGVIDLKKLDMFQVNHFRRYEFACGLADNPGVCGDFACGTGYGSVMLAQKAEKVIGADINAEVIAAIKSRYADILNVEFLNKDLLALKFDSTFDTLVSFETIEHFTEENIVKLLGIFNRALKTGGTLIISTPFLQERNEAAIELGHHLTFYIDENKFLYWFSLTGFRVKYFKYQNYATHMIMDDLDHKDFIICVAEKLKHFDA